MTPERRAELNAEWLAAEAANDPKVIEADLRAIRERHNG